MQEHGGGAVVAEALDCPLSELAVDGSASCCIPMISLLTGIRYKPGDSRSEASEMSGIGKTYEQKEFRDVE